MQTPGSTVPAVPTVPTVPTVPRPTPLRGASAGPSPTLGGVAALEQYRASEKWRAEQRSELWEKLGFGEKVPLGAYCVPPKRTPLEGRRRTLRSSIGTVGQGLVQKRYLRIHK